MRSLAPLTLLALLLGSACHVVPPAHEVDGEQVLSPASEASEATLEVAERMLSMAVSGQVIGVIETRLERAPDGSETIRERVTTSMIREGGGPEARFESVQESVTIYDAQHELVSDTEVELEAEVTITRKLYIEDGEMVSVYSGPGRPEEIKRFELPPDYRSSLAVEYELLERWREQGEPATIRYSTFDADRERFKPMEVTILGETTHEHGGEHIPAYVFRTVDEDGTVINGIIDHNLLALEVEVAGTFVVSLVDEAPDLAAAGSVGRINSELPISGRTTSAWWELAEQKVSVRVEGDDPEAPALWESSHYHRVEREGSDYELTLLTTRPSKNFRPPSLPLDIEDPELLRYLEPTTSAQSDDPALVAEAQSIVGSERNSLLAAARIVESVFMKVDKRAGVRGSATATEVLHNRAGDCTEHAVLVVALMRAAGIPARAVDGIVLASDGGGAGMGGYHAWAEIWLGEWIGVDATVNETGTSARYLQFGIDEPGEISSGGKMMRSIGKTSIELGPFLTYEELATP